ncbi:MAG: SMI1/KNR4 family protein [Sandaracinaceae bacterium]|nr:SMI1/KNR4 family protein [Sandaracinaceae bacterium]
MHSGVSALIQWAESRNGKNGVQLNPPAQAFELAAFEHHIGAPLPSDFRAVLGRFDGGRLPGVILLGVSSRSPLSIHAALSALKELKPSDAQSWHLLPFGRTEHGSWLAFDRDAAPLSDIWPIVDVDVETGEVRLVHRTFDAWCRMQVGEWSSPGFEGPFTLDRYLEQGLRHASIDPDVSVAHSTVGHALRRMGKPKEALAAYLRAGRCVPAEPHCDWEALKLAFLLEDHLALLEALRRLSQRVTPEVWAHRGTTPSRVAFVLARALRRKPLVDPAIVKRLMFRLVLQAIDENDKVAVEGIWAALERETPLPWPSPPPERKVPELQSPEEWWKTLVQAYRNGILRDEDLALDPIYETLGRHRMLQLLHIRRDF